MFDALRNIDFRYKVMAIVGVVLFTIIGLAYWHTTATETKLQQAIKLSQDNMTQVNALQNKLNLSQSAAEDMKKFYERALAGKEQPVSNFYVTAPTVQQAADQVTDRINKKDPTLPPAALEKTDRTAVVPNETQQKVDVFKFNNYRKWEWGAGVGIHDGDKYIPVSLQRNYSKDRAVEFEAHVKPDGGGVTGGEIKYKVKTDKLFFIF